MHVPAQYSWATKILTCSADKSIKCYVEDYNNMQLVLLNVYLKGFLLPERSKKEYHKLSQTNKIGVMNRQARQQGEAAYFKQVFISKASQHLQELRIPS